jgi:ABC-type phosphate/phosphonate transport system substrate-binding protein
MIKKTFFSFKICFLLLIAALFISSLLRQGIYAQSSKDTKPLHTYSFITITTERFGEADSVGLAKIMDGLTEDLYRKTGIKSININPGVGSYEESIYKNKPDFAFMGIEHVMKLKELGLDMEPLVLASMLGKPGMQICIYTMKDYKDVKSLRGVSVNLYGGGTYNAAHMALRNLLYENGVDIPLEDFFGDIYRVPYEGSNFQALILGKVQVVVEGDWNYKFYGMKLPQAKSIKTLACTVEYPAVGIFMRKGIDPDDVAKLKNYLKKIHKNAMLKELRTLVIAMKIQFVDPDPELMKRVDILYRESVEKGWCKEAKQLSGKMGKLQFGQFLKKGKKSYAQCKKECKRDKNKESCMDRCMGE